MPESRMTPREIVELYIHHTSNRGDPGWIPRLCADPVQRHDPNAIRPMSHAEQMDRIANSRLRPLGPFFRTVQLHADGAFVTWVWDMTLEHGDKRLCGIEVFKVQDGLITDVWNAPYGDGTWPD